MSNTTTEPTPAPEPRKRRSPLKTAGLVALAIVGIGTAGVATARAYGYGPGHHGFGHHRMGFMGGPIDPARAEDGINRLMKHFAVEVDATPEQTQKLADIGKAAVKDLLPLREKMRDARSQGRDLLVAPVIDRAKIEALRAEQLGHAEAMSKRVAKALGDAAEVLTPEQRKKAAERMEAHRGRWMRWHRG
jgi:Spy/CpxP family protein refolding chaperone